MPDYTKNYNFIKPKKTENYDIDDVTRKNMDITDTELFNKQNKEPGKGLSTNDFTNAYKTKLDSLKNYDDTELKKQVDKNTKSIQDIEKEQLVQNSSISSLNYYVEQNSKEIYENSNNIIALQKENTALKEELERQKEDNRLNGLTEDNEGELLHITNTTGARFNSLEIFGNEKQKTRSGKNIYGAGSKWFNNIGGTNLNVSERTDSSCVLTATGRGFTSFGSGQAGGSSEYRTEIEPNTEYTFSLKAELLSGSNGIGIYGFFSKDGSSEYFSEKHVDYADEITFVTPEDAKYFYFRVDIFNASASYRISEIQLEKGSKATEFEEYGAMPSFDYPSEVRAVGDNINIFNDEAYKGFKVTQQNYKELEKVDLKLELNKYYVAKIYFEDGTSVATNNSNFMLYGYKADGTQSMNIPNGIAKTYSNATELVKAKIVANATGLSTYANKVVAGIKIEEVENENGQASRYSNYSQGCIELKVVNKNFLDVQKNAAVTKNGVTVTTDENGILTINGTSNANIYFQLNAEGLADDNISKWKQNHFKKGNYVFSVENLSSIQSDNVNALVRENAYAPKNVNEVLTSILNAKTKSKEMNFEEDVDVVCYLWIRYGTTLNNVKLKFQIGAGTATDILAHEKQPFVIPVQQKMFTEDKFAKIDGVWKETHNWVEYAFDGTTEGFGMNWGEHVFGCTVKKFTNQNQTKKAYSNRFKFDTREALMVDLKDGYFAMQKNFDAIYFKDESCSTAEEFIAKVVALYEAGTPLKVVYKLNTPIKLDCTDEQIAILDQIEQQAHTYKEVTNIYTTDEVGAILKTNTNVDLKSVINNVVTAQLAQIGG